MCLFCLVVKYCYQKLHHYYHLLPEILLKTKQFTLGPVSISAVCVFFLSSLPHTREQEHLGGKNKAGPNQLPARHLGWSLLWHFALYCVLYNMACRVYQKISFYCFSWVVADGCFFFFLPEHVWCLKNMLHIFTFYIWLPLRGSQTFCS